MARLRLEWIRPLLVLTDTPRPGCRTCHGEGGIACDYGDETGEYAGTDWEHCDCWNPDQHWTLLRLPQRRRPYRDPWATPGGYSDEPPF